MYRVTIEAESVENLSAKCIALAATMGLVTVGERGKTTAPVVDRECDPAPEAVSEKKPVGRPRKLADPVAVEPEAKPAPKAEPKAEKPKKYTLDQVRTALQTYAQKVDPDASVGILKVRELLAQFQSTKHVPCQKISEVQDQDYAALVAACGA